MEHPLNGQYVLRCQLLYYKLCWSVYSYFISFINLFFPFFACKHIFLPSSSHTNSSFASSAKVKVILNTIEKGEEQRVDELEGGGIS